MLRFLFNKYSGKPLTSADLSLVEINRAERVLLKMVQEESFEGISDPHLSKLKPHKDEFGLIRLRTKIWARKDSEDFRSPVILPSNHELVSKLVLELHKRNGHVMGQTLLNLLRERFWILRSRQTARKVVQACKTCQRHSAKHFDLDPLPLPENRVRDANVLEVCGTDLAGPLYLKGGEKVWICIFTCGVFRAVHLEIVSPRSTDAFLMAFRRFIALRGRPSIMYSDNGLNFKGANNALQEIDWDKVSAQGVAERIDWRFNPPKAPWWGGFWERMIGVLKVLLRKILGRASLSGEELQTVAYEWPNYINQRPITYSSDDPDDPIPISPLMFLQELPCSGVADIDSIDASSIKRKLRRRLQLKELHQRFRLEYLGLLKLPPSRFQSNRGRRGCPDWFGWKQTFGLAVSYC
ncbi:Pao retrotransposon peptidase [Nesidiocoris tenuis]|uniref:Pao retrotransposon peptidase n=2 Tax=Nesidiocoris tenuis TaxID=355587 RepID=A0ABN7BCN4_9HEMI|nr:Pao retrotransposon peptidase [Nesidiocoris tenuis]